MRRLLFLLTLAVSMSAPALTDFDLEAYKQLSKSENFAFSPYSLARALDLLRQGTKGSTRKLLDEKLAGQNLADPVFSRATISVANGFWWDTSIHANEDYVRTLKNATVGALPFAKDPAASASKINAWASEKTHGLIPHLYGPDELGQALAILANSIYVKDRWEVTRDLGVENRAFNGGAKIPFLTHGKSSRKYFDTGTVRLLEIAMTDVTYGIVMPSQNFAQWKTSLTASDLMKWRASAKRVSVIAKTPKMKIEVDAALTETLSQLGLASLFSVNADFSPITPAPLKISGVKQKVVFDVNEKGIEAAAVTAVMMEGTSFRPDIEKPIEFIADKPFLFYLAAGDQILFLGQYTKP